MSEVHVRLRLADEAYAIAVEHVLEVVPYGDVVPVPGSHAWALGVRNLRGEVLPVFDLASAFGAGRTLAPERLLVLEHDGRRAAFTIDDVVDIGPPQDGEIAIVDVPQLFASLAGAAA
ncbi:MAG: chemotaxis protein CheW [Gaiellaceae bacterium]